MDQENKSSVIQTLEEQLASNPSNIRLLHQLSLLSKENKDYSKALHYAESYAQNQVNDPEAQAFYLQAFADTILSTNDLAKGIEKLNSCLDASRSESFKALDIKYIGEALRKIAVRTNQVDELISSFDSLSYDSVNLELFILKLRYLTGRDKNLSPDLSEFNWNELNFDDLYTLYLISRKSDNQIQTVELIQFILQHHADIKYKELRNIVSYIAAHANDLSNDLDLSSTLKSFLNANRTLGRKRLSKVAYLFAELSYKRGDYDESGLLYQLSIQNQIHSDDYLDRDQKELHLLPPDYWVIGVMKCGTSSLYDTLIQHDQILPAATKELHFLQGVFRDSGINSGELNHAKNFYKQLFPKRRKDDSFITGEASGFSIFEKGIHQVLHGINPDAKLITILRDPISRAISHYNHRVRAGVEKRTLNQAMRNELDYYAAHDSFTEAIEFNISKNKAYKYLVYGFYHYWLKDWYNTFEPSQILVISAEQLRADRSDTLNKIFRHLNIDVKEIEVQRQKNVGNYKTPMDEDILEEMQSLYKEDTLNLNRLIGHEFKAWKRI